MIGVNHGIVTALRHSFYVQAANTQSEPPSGFGKSFPEQIMVSPTPPTQLPPLPLQQSW